jgi:multiple sugar transport system ATP-binding protein
MASVDLEHVEKIYPGGARALLDCTLAVADGELLVLVGPSGCGKSTLLRLIAGLEEPTSGTLRIGGTVVNALTPQQRNVAMVFQDYALYPYMSVRRNLAFPLKMRRLASAEIERRVAWAAGLLGLGALLDRLPKQLSGGQRQRVAMGRALVREPTVFLLDEPLSNLDAKLRVQVRAEIGDLQRRTGTTMVYVTHDQVEAMTLGHRVAVMNEGRLQQVAPPRELYERPANAFVAGFIGNPPMNLLPASLSTGADGGAVVTVAGYAVSLPPGRLGDAGARDLGVARLTAGIRPDDVRLADAAGDGPALAAVVDHVEWLGHETLAHVHVGDEDGGVRLVVRAPGLREIAHGAAVALRIDAARLHLFGADGRALTTG